VYLEGYDWCCHSHLQKTEIASNFNTFYLTQHKLEPNRKKKEKIRRKQKGEQRRWPSGRTVHKRIISGGVKGSIKKH
jgi:hypothetical protein